MQCSATVAAVDVLSKLAANLVKEGSNVQAKLAATGISDPCDLPYNLVLHYKSINMHGLKRMASHS